MPVRKTESRLPANFQASDLGQAVVTADGKCALVSFITSPLVVNRENVYVLFVTDVGLAASARSFEWTFTDSENVSVTEASQHGEFSFTPQSAGSLNVKVRILKGGNVELAALEMVQEVGSRNAELEDLIVTASNEPGPGVSNPDVARELINDHNPYYQAVTLQVAEPDDAFQRFVFGMVFNGALERTSAHRKQHLEQLADSLNTQTADFVTLTAEGAGVCGIRLSLLAMTFNTASPPLAWTELPEPVPQRAVADESLRNTLAALNEDTRLDLFNLARFPKSNITQCGRIVEALRDRYFSGTNFNDVLTGFSGTRAHWIIRHYREGPLTRT